MLGADSVLSNVGMPQPSATARGIAAIAALELGRIAFLLEARGDGYASHIASQIGVVKA